MTKPGCIEESLNNIRLGICQEGINSSGNKTSKQTSLEVIVLSKQQKYLPNTKRISYRAAEGVCGAPTHAPPL